MDKDIDYELYAEKWTHHSPKGKQVLLSRAIKLSSYPTQTQDAYKFWGDLNKDLNNHPKSLIKFKRAFAIDDNSYEIANCIAASFENLNMPEEALAYTIKALEIAPGSYESHRNLLQRLKRLNRFEEMESRYEEFLNRNPAFRNRARFYYIKAEILKEINEYPAALTSYRKATEVSPEYSHYHFQYGMALYHETFYQEALKEFEKAVELEPNDNIAHNNIAFMRYNLGLVLEAISDLEAVIENNREIYTTYFNLILFKYHLEQNEEVIQLYAEKLQRYIASDRKILKKIYNQDLILAENKLKENLDEETKEFNLRRLGSLKFVLSLIE